MVIDGGMRFSFGSSIFELPSKFTAASQPPLCRMHRAGCRVQALELRGFATDVRVHEEVSGLTGRDVILSCRFWSL